jgi:hypothetical protein
VGRPPSQHTYKYSNLNAFVTKNQHIFGEPCVNHDSTFHRLQLRLASPESFSSLADLIPLSPPAVTTTAASAPADLCAIPLSVRVCALRLLMCVASREQLAAREMRRGQCSHQRYVRVLWCVAAASCWLNMHAPTHADIDRRTHTKPCRARRLVIW